MSYKISAVITTYMRPFAILQRSILSIKAQTYNDIEIIIVDDNDPDSPFRDELIKGLKKFPEIVLISHKTNQGSQVSRNDGILNSSGDWIAFLDDDDEWLPNKIEKQITLSESLENIGLVYCRGFTVFENPTEQKIIPYANDKHFSQEVTFEDLLFSDKIGTTTQALVKRDVFTECGLFDVQQPARQDYEMWIRISMKFRCVGVDEPLFRHYIHTDEQISRNFQKSIAGYKGIGKKYKYFFNRNLPAKCRLSLSIAKEYRKAKMYIPWLGYSFLVFIFLIPSVLFQWNILRKQVK